jgi:hypothetical protein
MIKRRDFVKQLAITGIGTGLMANPVSDWKLISSGNKKEIKLGVIGLAVHSAAFSTFLNDKDKKDDLAGCRIEALYHPPGNPDVEFTVKQLADFKSTVEKAGVKIVSSIDELLGMVDGVLIETNDGRPHMEQLLPVLKAGKAVFVDKPVAEDLSGVIRIYNAAAEYNVPIFSSSSLRYGSRPQEINKTKKNQVLGADTYSPASLEPSHTDLYWYGIHGVEMLYTVMGTGCQEVWQIGHSKGVDVLTGVWENDRVGIFRGIREGKRDYGGTVFMNDDIVELGTFEGYRPLVVKIVEFFTTGQSPVSKDETLEIYAFMTAANISKLKGGKRVSVTALKKEFGINV